MIFVHKMALFVLLIAVLEVKKWPLKLIFILLLFVFTFRFVTLPEFKDNLLIKKYFLKAIVEGDVNGVKKLLEKGVHVNQIIHDGLTPLICACVCNKKDIASLLIQNGAYVNAKGCNDGSSSLHYACARGNLPIIQLLIEKGAKINLKNNQGVTPLHCTAAYRQIKAAKLLLDKGANIHDKDIMERTVLHRAAKRGYTQLLKLFLSKGSYVDQKDKYGCSPLFYACANNQIHAVDILIQSGASFLGRPDLLDWALFDNINKRIALFYSKN